jgi:hypothetical protein
VRLRSDRDLEMAEEAEERRGEVEERRGEAEASGDPVYKTKAVQFLGRTTPIVLQNENGPCPLLAICIFLFSIFYSLLLLEYDSLIPFVIDISLD